MTDTAEYWNDIKNRRRYPRHVFTHLMGVDCGHYHVKESTVYRDIDCHACRKLIKKKAKELMEEPKKPEPKNIGLKQLREQREQTIARWEKIGLLEGLNGDVNEKIGSLFECLHPYHLSDNDTTKEK